MKKRLIEARRKASSVQLILSRGSQKDYAVMPAITGMTRVEADEALKELGISIGKVTALNTAEYVRGQIAVQSVKPGDYVKKGTLVDVSLSVGESSNIADGTEISYAAEEKNEGNEGSGLSDEYYYGSIDTSCSIGAPLGPGGSDRVMVAVRLKQRVDGADEYTQIAQPIPVAPGTKIPISYKNIRGAYGVDSGYVEVYNADTMEMYASFNISFHELDD